MSNNLSVILPSEESRALRLKTNYFTPFWKGGVGGHDFYQVVNLNDGPDLHWKVMVVAFHYSIVFIVEY